MGDACVIGLDARKGEGCAGQACFLFPPNCAKRAFSIPGASDMAGEGWHGPW
jgi:hypothetical protein